MALLFLSIDSTSAAPTSCDTCHTPLASVFGTKTHPSVKGNTISACLPCHAPGNRVKPGPNPYSAKLHRGHHDGPGKTDCTLCHIWGSDSSFGIPGSPVSLGKVPKDDMPVVKEIVTSWAQSTHLDNIHSRKNISCGGCHGTEVPELDSTVDNRRCLQCHGTMEALVEKTKPKDFADRNPHKSHLGDIACTVCHHGHKTSTVYCLGCHAKWTMKIPGGGSGKDRK